MTKKNEKHLLYPIFYLNRDIKEEVIKGGNLRFKAQFLLDQPIVRPFTEFLRSQVRLNSMFEWTTVYGK